MTPQRIFRAWRQQAQAGADVVVLVLRKARDFGLGKEAAKSGRLVQSDFGENISFWLENACKHLFFSLKDLEV